MNFRGLKKFCLVLENCEEIVLTPDEVVRFRLCGIKNEVIYASGGIIEYQSCEELFLELSPQADRHYDWYGETSEDRAFQRLARPDLTNVELIREAMGAALSSKIQVLTSGPYLSSENDLSLPEDGRFVLCNAHTGDIPESWGLEDQEKLVDTQYSKLAVEPAFFLNMTLFYCPFEYHRIIYTKEILGDGISLSNQEDEDPYSIADKPSTFDDR